MVGLDFRLNCFSYWCHCCLKSQKSHQTRWIIENLIWVWIKLRQILGHDCQTLFLIQILFIINQQILISCLFSYKNIHFPPALFKCFENSQVGSMDLPGHNEPHRIWTFSFPGQNHKQKTNKKNQKGMQAWVYLLGLRGDNIGICVPHFFFFFQALMQSSRAFAAMSCKQEVTDLYTSRSPCLFTLFPCTPKGSAKKK